MRSFRVPADLWDAARAKAQAEGRSIAEVLTTYLKRYVSTPPRKRGGDE